MLAVPLDNHSSANSEVLTDSAGGNFAGVAKAM